MCSSEHWTWCQSPPLVEEQIQAQEQEKPKDQSHHPQSGWISSPFSEHIKPLNVTRFYKQICQYQSMLLRIWIHSPHIFWKRHAVNGRERARHSCSRNHGVWRKVGVWPHHAIHHRHAWEHSTNISCKWNHWETCTFKMSSTFYMWYSSYKHTTSSHLCGWPDC